MNSVTVFPQDSSTVKQVEGNKVGQWKGLFIDRSTPEDAIRILGKPDKVSNARLVPAFSIGRWMLTGGKDQKVHTLEYKNVKDFKRVTLQFESNKLVVIYLWFDDTLKLKPAQIAANYDIELFPFLAMFQNLSPDQFVQQHKQRIEQGIITPLSYPTVYPLLGLTSQTFVISQVATGVFTNSGSTVSFPGTAFDVMLVSRTLENKQKEVDALK
jgi:hypothetical protein